jgi:hypothetical protein
MLSDFFPKSFDDLIRRDLVFYCHRDIADDQVFVPWYPPNPTSGSGPKDGE